MTIPLNEIVIPTNDGLMFSAYCKIPARTPAPTVIVIQEIFGINAEIRAKCDRLAEAGYMAIAPDLFWRLEAGVDLTDRTDAEMQKAFDLFNRFDIDKGIADLTATLNFIRAHEFATGKTGCTGYCLGGKLAYLMACRTDIDASVGYYGVDIASYLHEASRIRNPLLLHIASEDEFVPPAQQNQMHASLDSNPQVTLYDYPGMDHAFSRTGGRHYNEQAARTANARTDAFLKAHLFTAA